VHEKPEDPHADRNGSADPQNFDLLAFEKYNCVYEKSRRDQNSGSREGCEYRNEQQGKAALFSLRGRSI